MLIGVFYSLKTNILLFVYQLKWWQESLFLLLEKNISSKKNDKWSLKRLSGHFW